jgi:transcriptional regulator of met regulon
VYEYFKKEGEEYKNMTADVTPVKCCKIYDDENYKKSVENQNVPKSCPIKVVSIITHKPVFS